MIELVSDGMITKEKLFPVLETEDIIFKPLGIRDLDEEYWKLDKKRGKIAGIKIKIFFTSIIGFVIHGVYTEGLMPGVYLLIAILAYFLIFTSISEYYEEKFSLPGFIISKRGIIPLNIAIALHEYLISPKLFNRRIPVPFEKINIIEIVKRYADKNLSYYTIWIYMVDNQWNHTFDNIINIQDFLQVLLPRIPKDVKWRIFEGKRKNENERENVMETLQEFMGEEKWREIHSESGKME